MSLNYKNILHWPFEDVSQSYSEKDSMMYALSLGLGFNPTDPGELKYVFEKGLQTFPTMAVVLGHPGPWMSNPETGIDFAKVLHGEQHLEIHAIGVIRNNQWRKNRYKCKHGQYCKSENGLAISRQHGADTRAPPLRRR